jgi:hypothetical protein
VGIRPANLTAPEVGKTKGKTKGAGLYIAKRLVPSLLFRHRSKGWAALSGSALKKRLLGSTGQTFCAPLYTCRRRCLARVRLANTVAPKHTR